MPEEQDVDAFFARLRASGAIVLPKAMNPQDDTYYQLVLSKRFLEDPPIDMQMVKALQTFFATDAFGPAPEGAFYTLDKARFAAAVGMTDPKRYIRIACCTPTCTPMPYALFGRKCVNCGEYAFGPKPEHKIEEDFMYGKKVYRVDGGQWFGFE